MNFTLTTAVGDLDLLGEVTGGGSYEELLSSTELVTVFEKTVRCLERLNELDDPN